MILIALAAAVLGPPGVIEDSDARTIYTDTIGSNGGLTPDCAQWNTSRQSPGKRSSPLEAWVEGLITGYNVYHAKNPEDRLDLLKGRSLSEAYKAIDQRCANTPDAALADVTLDLISEWRKR